MAGAFAHALKYSSWLVLSTVFDLETDKSSWWFASCALFAFSVVGCMLGYLYLLVVWSSLFLDPSDGVFGRFDLAALCGCRTLNFVCLFVEASSRAQFLTSPLGRQQGSHNSYQPFVQVLLRSGCVHRHLHSYSILCKHYTLNLRLLCFVVFCRVLAMSCTCPPPSSSLGPHWVSC